MPVSIWALFLMMLVTTHADTIACCANDGLLSQTREFPQSMLPIIAVDRKNYHTGWLVLELLASHHARIGTQLIQRDDPLNELCRVHLVVVQHLRRELGPARLDDREVFGLLVPFKSRPNLGGGCAKSSHD